MAMLRWPPLTLAAISLVMSSSWSLVARAQSDGAPLPDAPTTPPAPVAPSEPEPPSAPPPPSADAPGPPSAEPPAPAPAVPPPGAPPSSAFPLSPTTPESRPQPQGPVAPPAAAPAPEPAQPTRPQRPSEGLFEERQPPAAVHRHKDEGDGSEKKEGTDQFKIGPVIGVGVPSVLSFGGTIKVTRFLGAGINVGLIPKIKLSYYGDATLSYQHYDIYGRIYPFGGGFFLSGGAGYATVNGTLAASDTRSVNGINGTVTYNGEGSVRTLMLTALIGYFYTTSVGFSIGVDAGAQIPLAPSQIEFNGTYTASAGQIPLTQAQIDTLAGPYITKSEQSIRDSLEKIGRSVLPTLNLRVGWIL